MTMFGVTKTANATADGSVPLDEHGHPAEWCGYCSNSGVAMLEGTDHVDGVEYSRGSAPCPWCKQGELRYAEWTSDTGIRKGTDRQGGKHVSHHRRFEPRSDFTMYDVLETMPEPRRGGRFVPTREWLDEQRAAGVPRGALALLPGGRALLPPIDDDAAVTEKRRRALEAKNHAEQEGSP